MFKQKVRNLITKLVAEQVAKTIKNGDYEAFHALTVGKSEADLLKVENARKLEKAIEDYDFETYKQLMRSEPNTIAWSYFNKNGDTLLHVACRATKFCPARIKKQFCLDLIKKLGKGFLNIRNKEGKLPHDLIGGQFRIGEMLDNVPSWDGSVDEALLDERNYRISEKTGLNQGALYRPDLKRPLPSKPEL
jgi:hypothetical protein